MLLKYIAAADDIILLLLHYTLYIDYKIIMVYNVLYLLYTSFAWGLELIKI